MKAVVQQHPSLVGTDPFGVMVSLFTLPNPAGVAQRNTAWRSSSGAVRVQPRTIAYPRSVDAISELIVDVAKRGGTVRPLGDGQSCSPIMVSNDTMVSLSQLAIPTVELNETDSHPLATFRASAPIGAIAHELASYGYALPQLFSPTATATLGGLLSTAGRGEGAIVPPLHQHVLAMEIIDGRGERRWLTKPEELRAARCALGTLGIITRVAMRVVPDANYSITRVSMDMEDVFKDFEVHTRDHDVVWFDWQPHSNRALMTVMDKSDEPVTPGRRAALRRLARRMVHKGAAHLPMTAHLSGIGVAQLWTSSEEIQPAAFAIPPKDVRGVHHMGAVLPTSTWRDAIYALYDIMVKHGVPAPLPVQISAVARDTTAWLSPAIHGPGVQLTWGALPGTRCGSWFSAALDSLIDHGGRPNWDGVQRMTVADVARLYPHFDRFTKVRMMMDPQGVFTSRAIATLLGKIN